MTASDDQATRTEPIDPELLHLAAKAMVRAGLADQITVVREALAAVLPAHEAMVREAIALSEGQRASALRTRARQAQSPLLRDSLHLRADTLDSAAARIARGEA